MGNIDFQTEDIPGAVYNNWQRIVNIMGEILGVTASLITKSDKQYIKIIKANRSTDNPLKEGQVFKLSGHYCEQVIKNKEMVEVVNCIKDQKWQDNPELELGLISYLGYPILKPDGEVFGTICVLDKRERKFKERHKYLIYEFKKVVESEFKKIVLTNDLGAKLDEINVIKEECEVINNSINDALFLHKYYKKDGGIKLGNFVKVNEEACKRLGYSREKLLTMSPSEIDTVNSSRLKKVLTKLSKEGKITFETNHIAKNGKHIPVEISSRIIKYNKQELVLSVARNIEERKNSKRKLKELKNLLQSSLDSLSAHIAVLDKEGIIRYTNKAWDEFAKNNNLAPEAAGIGVNYLKICKESTGEWSHEAMLAYKGIKEVMKGNSDEITIEYPCHSPEEKRWFNMRITPFRGTGPYSVVITHENTTERILAQKELKKSEQKFRNFVENANDIVYTLSTNGIFKYVSPNWTDIIGHNTTDVVGKSFEEFVHPADIQNCRDFLEKVLQTGKKQSGVEYRVKCTDGIWRWYTTNGSIINEEGEQITFLGIAHDITERKKEEEKIRYLSFHDEMTGLYNRRFFENEIKRLNKSRKIPISIIIGDMDGLKFINDNYGHKMGDKYLKKSGEIFSIVTRSEDILARIGGDEFAVVLPDTGSRTADKICKRIDKECETFNASNKLPKPLRISLGFATMESREQNLNTIFNKADKRMYKNKEKRREKST